VGGFAVGKGHARSSGLLAGAAEVAVTPAAEGTFLVGPMKPSTGVHDDLYARALVLADGAKQAAIVTLDYLGFDFAYNHVLEAAVAEATGIPAGQILINCSHTHSAPLTAPWGPWEKAKDKPFHKQLPRKLAEVVRRAKQDLKPARLRCRREPTQIGFNRRLLHGGRVVMAPNPGGAVLPWTDVLSVEGGDGKGIAVLFSYAAHPVIVHAASTLISADYPGFAVKALRESRDKRTTYLFAHGCGGNVNAFPLRGGIDAAQAAGRDLGQAVARALDGETEPIAAGKLAVTSAELTLPLQPPPSAQQCRQMLARAKSAERKEQLAGLLALAESGKRRTMPFPMRAVTVGERLCILALPHEPFAEYGLFADKASPFEHTMVLGYTNGMECYVGTKRDYELGERGGYETSPRGAAAMYEAAVPLAPEAEQIIRKGIAKLLKESAAASGAKRVS
jgi:hypothetical protein